MRLLGGIFAVLLVGVAVPACSTGEDTGPTSTEDVGDVSQAVTAACTTSTLGFPCDPDGPGSPKLECEGVCWLGASGLVGCFAVAAGSMNGIPCGTVGAVGDAACKRVCSGKTCMAANAAAGAACRPNSKSDPCDGQCDGAGHCGSIAQPCEFGRNEQLCTFDLCSFTNATDCKTQNLASNTLCSDADACSIGKCNGKGACVAGPTVGCDDGNACTDDECDADSGACLGSIDDSNGCSDSNACTTGDFCSAGACQAGVGAPNCDDNNACTTDTCDPNTGCAHVAKSCSDGDACTTDTCNPIDGSCSHGALSCDDDDACTIDGCNVNTGCTHVAQDCNDNNGCTADTCSAGTCQHAAVSCDDNDGCTVDSCSAGSCQHVALSCDDNDGCTVDSCSAGSCVHSAATCDDDNACTADSCAAGSCQHSPVSCDDNDVCTADGCAPASGCLNVAIQGCSGGGGTGGTAAEGGAAGEPASGGAGGVPGEAGAPGLAGDGPVAGTGNEPQGGTSAGTSGSTSGGSSTSGASTGGTGGSESGGSSNGGDASGVQDVSDTSSGCGCEVPGRRGPANGAGLLALLGAVGLVAARRARKAA
jgi:hypothetical protein